MEDEAGGTEDGAGVVGSGAGTIGDGLCLHLLEHILRGIEG